MRSTIGDAESRTTLMVGAKGMIVPDVAFLVGDASLSTAIDMGTKITRSGEGRAQLGRPSDR